MKELKNVSKTAWWAKVKSFQCYVEFSKVFPGLGKHIHQFQACNTLWVNSPAWCPIKIKLNPQQLMKSLSFQEILISLNYHR